MSKDNQPTALVSSTIYSLCDTLSATQYTNYYLHYDYIGKEDQNPFLLCSNLYSPLRYPWPRPSRQEGLKQNIPFALHILFKFVLWFIFWDAQIIVRLKSPVNLGWITIADNYSLKMVFFSWKVNFLQAYKEGISLNSGISKVLVPTYVCF